MDIKTLKETGDIRSLIRLLDDRNPDVQWKAADALGSIGEAALDPLLKIVEFPKLHVRLGAIEALGEIRNPRAIEPLVQRLKKDPDHEVRWVAAIALGEIGDPRVVPDLISAMHDSDRYVRYGAAKALEVLHWTPDNSDEQAYFHIALQDWHAVKKMGPKATVALIDITRDPAPTTRKKIIEILGEKHHDGAQKICEKALMDTDAGVRWAAVHSCKRLGVSTHRIPLILARRPKGTPSAVGAALLNLFFFGLGYHYIGKWWAFSVFMCYMTVMALVQLYSGVLFPFIYIYPFTAISAVQTYYMVKKMPAM